LRGLAISYRTGRSKRANYDEHLCCLEKLVAERRVSPAGWWPAACQRSGFAVA
jgi:hypothetical protein